MEAIRRAPIQLCWFNWGRAAGTAPLVGPMGQWEELHLLNPPNFAKPPFAHKEASNEKDENSLPDCFFLFSPKSISIIQLLTP